MFIGKKLGAFLLWASLSIPLKGQDLTSPWEISGYVKYLSEGDHLRIPDTLFTGQLIHQRTMFRYEFNPHWYLRADIRTRIFYGTLYENQTDFGMRLQHPEAYFRPEMNLTEDRHLTIFTEADRAYAGYRNETWDIRLGKQRINWGTNLIWNPNDIFNTYNILDFDYEERSGTDAIRVQYDLGKRRSAEIAFSPARGERTVGAAMYRTHLKTFDLQVLAGTYRKQSVIGIGWAGNLKDVGFKGEINHYVKNPVDSNQTCIAMTFDYTLRKQWYVFISGLWQENATENTLPSSSIKSGNEITPKYLMPFRYSWYAGTTKELSPLWTLQLAAIYGGKSQSLILFPCITWNITDDIQFLLAAQGYFSRKGAAWGNQADAFYLRFKYSFRTG